MKLSRIIISGFIAVTSIAVLIYRVFIGFDFFTGGIVRPFDVEYLKYFTSLSNFYNGFVFLYVFILSLKHFKDDNYQFSKPAKILILSAVSSVAITFIVTVTFLNFSLPNPEILYQYEILFFHIINPLLSVVLFIFLLPGEKISLKESLFGTIPLVLYSIFYTIFVFTGVWTDHYNFTLGGHYWAIFIALPIVLGVSFLFNWGLSALNAKLSK